MILAVRSSCHGNRCGSFPSKGTVSGGRLTISSDTVDWVACRHRSQSQEA